MTRVHLARLALPLLAALSAAPRAAVIDLYQGAAGTMPQAQPWMTFIGLGLASSVAGGVSLDTRLHPSLAAGYFNHSLTAAPGTWALKNPAFPDLDPAVGFTLGFELALPDEDHLSNDRAGFSVILLGDDQKGIELGFWEDRIWAQSGPDFVQAEGVAVNTLTKTLYELTIRGLNYILNADGSQVLTGPTRDYTGATPSVDPYETPGMIFLGDDTSSASALFTLGSIRLEVPAPPPWWLLPAGLLALHRRRR